MIVLKRFHWDDDTLKYYADLLRHLHYWHVFYDIYNFVKSECILEEAENIIEIAVDLMRQVEERENNDTKEDIVVNS
jgi:hypothetical protein